MVKYEWCIAGITILRWVSEPRLGFLVDEPLAKSDGELCYCDNKRIFQRTISLKY